MQLHIVGASGRLHSLLVDGSETVGEIKQQLEEDEGIPLDLQVLYHAGNELKDAVPLEDYQMDKFNLTDEVTLHMQTRLKNPVTVFLSNALPEPHVVAETVELDTSVQQIVGILQKRKLVAELEEFCVTAKGPDGTTIPVALEAADTIESISKKIVAFQGVKPDSMTFCGSPDGQLHVILPNQPGEGYSDTHTVYKRSTLPQPLMLKKDPRNGKPYQAFVKDLCVMP